MFLDEDFCLASLDFDGLSEDLGLSALNVAFFDKVGELGGFVVMRRLDLAAAARVRGDSSSETTTCFLLCGVKDESCNAWTGRRRLFRRGGGRAMMCKQSMQNELGVWLWVESPIEDRHKYTYLMCGVIYPRHQLTAVSPRFLCFINLSLSLFFCFPASLRLP
jgi:hypothetical protein